MEKSLKAGERMNPDNMRYIDGQGMPTEEPGGVWSSEVKAFMHAHTLKGLFYSEDWVFITTDSIATPISQCPLRVFQESRAEDGRNKRDALESHPVSVLLANPNPHQSDVELRYSLAVDTILGGNGFLYHATTLKQIFNLPFERVNYAFDGQGIPCALQVFKQRQEDVFADPVSHEIPLTQIVHARRPNPSSAVWGLSPFIPGRRSVLFNRYSQDYLLAFYLKGATPQMILEMDKDASQQSLVRMIRSFESAYTGRRNQRRTLVLPKGVKATMADSKIADQQLTELVKANRETVLNILRVPKHALGLQESGSLGSREHELALRWYWKQTILPTMQLIEGALTRHFKAIGMLQPGQLVAFDTSEVDYVQEDLLGDAEVSKALETSWSLNERRDRIFGMPAVPGGDVILGAMPPAPFPMATPEPAAPPEAAAPGAPSEAPPKATTLPDAEPRPDALPVVAEGVADPDEKRDEGKAEPWHARVLRKYDAHLRTGNEGLDAQATEQIPAMVRHTAELFASMAERALDALEGSKRGLAGGFTRADDDEVKAFSERIQKLYAELEDAYVKGYVQRLMGTVDAGYETQVKMVFDEKAREALAAYKDTDVKGQRSTLAARGLFAFKSVSGTTTDSVTALVEKGLAGGLSLDKVATSIVGFMKEQARWRAEMVARTETLTAFSVGSMATMERAKKAIPGMKKMWVTSNDERVRKAHIELMGDIADPDEEFSNGLRYPRDPGSPNAAESINCRCVALMLPPEDVADYSQEIAALPKPDKPAKP